MRLPGRGQDRGATQSGTPREYFEEIHRGCQLRRLRQGPVLRALHFALAPPEQAPLEPEHPACSRRCCGHPQAPECVHLVPQGWQGDPPGISASRVRRAFSHAEGARFVVPECARCGPSGRGGCGTRARLRPEVVPAQLAWDLAVAAYSLVFIGDAANDGPALRHRLGPRKRREQVVVFSPGERPAQRVDT